ncbi:DUF547 domain-containing protein [Puniceicoccaceae bacterium K14]|nr:DUF547 domain-containing protein [Puniceicoccaceae bacterium K14]
MRITSFFLTIGLWLTSLTNASTFSLAELEHDWTTFLSKHVNANGFVDYTAIKADPAELLAIYRQLELHSPDSHPTLFPSENHRFAYWINAYNIAIMKAVIDNYPIESVQDVSSFSVWALFDGGVFFAGIKHRFGGKKWSLYNLEKKLIRKRFDDPRLHFALNCASIGCPELPQEAFKADDLETQLDVETRAFMNDPRKFRIDDNKKEIQVSSLFDWYEADYLAPKTSAKDILSYIKPYLNNANKDKLEVALGKGYSLTFIEYDWGLNDQALQ